MLNLSDKRILVTGGAGFLGSHLVRQLIARGVSESQITVPRAEESDLREFSVCERVVKNQDIIFHLAAKVGGIGFNQEHPGELFYDNIIMGTNLIEAARRENIQKFISVGTICAYPKFTPVPFKEENLWNGYPEETNAPYGLAKKANLVQIQAYRAQYGFPAIYILPVNLYGPGDNFDPKSSHVIPALIRKVSEAKKVNQNFVELWGTGRATREFLYVEDAARGLIMAAEGYDKSEPVNLGSGMEISISSLITKIVEIMDFKGEIRWDSMKPDGQPRRRLDVTRAEQEFGFRAQTNFEIGLRETVDWYNKNS